MARPDTKFATSLYPNQKFITWEIRDFPTLLKLDSLVDLPKVEFDVGQWMGHPLRWTVSLRSDFDELGKKWVGIHYNYSSLLSRTPKPDLCSHFSFEIKNKDGESTWQGESLDDISKLLETGSGIVKMIDPMEFTDQSLNIHITCRLYSSSSPMSYEVPDPPEPLWSYKKSFFLVIIPGMIFLLGFITLLDMIFPFPDCKARKY